MNFMSEPATRSLTVDDASFAGSCERLDPVRDVHGDAADVVAPSFDLTGVQSDPHIDAELLQRVAHLDIPHDPVLPEVATMRTDRGLIEAQMLRFARRSFRGEYPAGASTRGTRCAVCGVRCSRCW